MEGGEAGKLKIADSSQLIGRSKKAWKLGGLEDLRLKSRK